jgi:hypothetical protein
VQRGEDVEQGGDRWGSPRESVTGEAVLAAEERRCSNDGGGSGDWCGLLQVHGRKARVRRMGIEAGVAGKPSSLQDGNGDGSKSRGGGGSGDWRTAWVSSEKDLEGGGGSVRGVPRERKESEWWRGAEREGGHAGTSAWREKEGEKGGPGAAVGSAGAAGSGPQPSGTGVAVASQNGEGGGHGRRGRRNAGG